MEFSDVVRRRRMTRNYTTDPVDPALVERALDHATRAPTAGFSQGWAFVVLDTPADVRRFWSVTTDEVDEPDAWLAGMMRAPVVILPCSVKAAYLDRYAQPDKAHTAFGGRDESAWSMPYWDLDTAMAALLVMQTATDAGLGSCFFAIVPDRLDRVRAEFGLDGADAPHPIGALTIGHPAPRRAGAQGSPARRRRTPWHEVAHRGRFGAGWVSTGSTNGEPEPD